jgi:hypothetical protein
LFFLHVSFFGSATVQGKTNTQWHDKIVQYIKEKGTVYAFHEKYGYWVNVSQNVVYSCVQRNMVSAHRPGLKFWILLDSEKEAELKAIVENSNKSFY